MNLGQHLALTRPWWMWKDRTIQKALQAVKRRHCRPLIDRALTRNREIGRFPAAFKDLADPLCLARDPRNLERIEDGTYALTDQHLLGLSLTLKIPLRDLVLDETVWLQKLVRELCNPQVAEASAQAFALYRWEQGEVNHNNGGDLDPAAVGKVCERMAGVYRNEKQTAQAIWHVADGLGPILEMLVNQF